MTTSTIPAGRRWDMLGWGLLALCTILAAMTFRDYGNGFDAMVQDAYGKDILAWFQSDGADHSALNFRDLYFYGGLFDTLATLVTQHSPFPHWATRNLMEAVSGLLGLAGAWRLARHLGGPRAGVLALGTLALMPSYYGMMFINPKDIPFAAAAIWATYLMTKVAETLPRPPVRMVIGLGVTLGTALGVRIAGVLLLAYLAATLAAYLASYATQNGWNTRRLAAQAAEMTVLVALPSIIIAWAAMVALWPWALISPLHHPIEALTHFSGLSNGIETLFFGRHTDETYHPADYLPVYMLIKLPDVVLAMLVVAVGTGIIALWQSGRRAISVRLVPTLLAALFPIAYAVVTSPELYDAERHFLFVLPPLAVLAALATERALTKLEVTGRRRALVACCVVLAMGAGRQVDAAVDLHPYEYAYFNDLVGGLRGASGQFETEYWGTSLAEASDDLENYLVAHGMTRRERPWQVAVCGDAAQMGDHPHPLLQQVDDWDKAEFFIAALRGGCDTEMSGRVIATVGRDGVPFAVVKELRRVNAQIVAAPHS